MIRTPSGIARTWIGRRTSQDPIDVGFGAVACAQAAAGRADGLVVTFMPKVPI